jgi:hypothetical protein
MSEETEKCEILRDEITDLEIKRDVHIENASRYIKKAKRKMGGERTILAEESAELLDEAEELDNQISDKLVTYKQKCG